MHPAKRSAHGGERCNNDFGGTKNDHNSCNITAGNGHVEGREIRHLRLIARHRIRLARLLSLRDAGTACREAMKPALKMKR
jgi:hypothetical protein